MDYWLIAENIAESIRKNGFIETDQEEIEITGLAYQELLNADNN